MTQSIYVDDLVTTTSFKGATFAIGFSVVPTRLDFSGLTYRVGSGSSAQPLSLTSTSIQGDAAYLTFSRTLVADDYLVLEYNDYLKATVTVSAGAGNGEFEGGDDVIAAQPGNDTVYGDSGIDRYSGREASLTGASASPSVGMYVNLALGRATDPWGDTDTLVGIEQAWGIHYADTLISSANAETLEGGDGIDTATYSSPAANYPLMLTPIGIRLRDKTGADGTDTLSTVEQLQFSDKTVVIESQSHGSYADLPDTLYQFFVVGLGAAAGVTYRDQMAEAYRHDSGRGGEVLHRCPGAKHRRHGHAAQGDGGGHQCIRCVIQRRDRLADWGRAHGGRLTVAGRLGQADGPVSRHKTIAVKNRLAK